MVNVEDQPWQRLLIRRMSRDNPVHPGNYIRGKSARLRSGKVVRSGTESFRKLEVVQSGRIVAEWLLAFMERHAEYLNVTETDERYGCSSGAAFVTVMQSTDFRNGDDLSGACWLNRSRLRRIFL